MSDYPKRGRGRRHLNCEMYSACLEIVAAERWLDFNCGDCPKFKEYEERQGTASMLAGDKEPALCEECKAKPVMSPGGRLCASCMARRSNKNRKNAQGEGVGRPKGRPKKTPSKQPPKTRIRDYMGRKEASTELVITVHFDKHKEILGQISRLAEEETRTLELQVIHLLKSSLGTPNRN